MSAGMSEALLNRPVSELHGVGKDRGRRLAKLDIHVLRDLLLHRPRRYENRRRFLTISDLHRDETGLVLGRIVAMGVKRFRGGRRSVFEMIVEDASGRLHCRWWNMAFMEQFFKVGQELLIHGRLTGEKPRTMDHPDTEPVQGEDSEEEEQIHLNRIVPVHKLTEGIHQRWLRGLIHRELISLGEDIPPPFPVEYPPAFPTYPKALHDLHFPEEMEDAQMARRRLALDEWLGFQLEIQRRIARLRAHAKAPPCQGNNSLIRPFLSTLPFGLTEGQTLALRDIRQDMTGPMPMRRLLQGDVGAGKTVVAAGAALMALESERDVLIMAPTEILAEQHHRNFTTWFAPLGIRVQLRTGSHRPEEERKEQLPLSSAPERPARVLIGTHALLEEDASLPNLGLVIIDEQHKFGVSQREQLVRKGAYPHLLIMTATPIPRTLGLTLYGDLDVSILPELPGGRGDIRTHVRAPDRRNKVLDFIADQVDQGRQAYIVHPRVEKDDAGGLKSVKAEYEGLVRRFAPRKVGLLHGRMKPQEKERVMTEFRDNTVQVLLSTTVIEVGMDVPNATVMLIENADRYGLAQLHQLRGRIGRGSHDSHCILIGEGSTPEGRIRLETLARTRDGFEIAEADLKLRGPGEFLGKDQSGLPPFRFADLAADLDLVELARDLAREHIRGRNG